MNWKQVLVLIVAATIILGIFFWWCYTAPEPLPNLEKKICTTVLTGDRVQVLSPYFSNGYRVRLPTGQITEMYRYELKECQ